MLGLSPLSSTPLSSLILLVTPQNFVEFLLVVYASAPFDATLTRSASF